MQAYGLILVLGIKNRVIVRMKSKYTVFVCFLFASLSFGQSDARFSNTEVLADLEVLRTSLVEAHYNVYAYVSEQAFDSTYRAVKASIVVDSLNLLETTSIFQRLVSAVRNGHTEIDFPGQSYGAYARNGGTVFPLEIAFENGRSLVRKNWSDKDDIKPGSEVLSINGLSMDEILSRIYPQVSAERPYFKNVKIELYSFPRYYWQVFGQKDHFEVEFRSGERVETVALKAVGAIEGYEMKRTEVLNAKMDLKFFGRSAYLNPGNFSGDEPAYRQFIDSAFVEIRKRKSRHLIIDLRNNGGGDDSFSDYLVSFIADKPFRWNSEFTLKASRVLKQHVRQHYDTTNAFWQEVLRHENGEIYAYEFEATPPQPKAKRFNRDVYVLVNRQSHSQSAVAAAQIQDYSFGTIVGEETGDYPSLYASQFYFVLPHTSIPVKISKGYIVRVNGSKAQEGVIPDIVVGDHLLDDEDEILEALLDML